MGRRRADQGTPQELLSAVRRLRESRGEDAEALAILVPLLWPRLQRYSLPRLRWLADAEDAAADVAAETLLRALRKIQACRAETEREFLGWVQAIARRQILDLRRSPLPIGGAEVLGDFVTREVADGRQRQVTIPHAHAVQAALGSLSPELNWILRRRALEGASWRQLASELGCSIPAARRRYERARQGVRAFLTDGGT